MTSSGLLGSLSGKPAAGVVRVRVTADEADAMAVGCDEPKCWAVPRGFCKTPSGTRRRPHPQRVAAARRAGMLEGRGRAWVAENGGLNPPSALILPPQQAQEVAGAC